MCAPSARSGRRVGRRCRLLHLPGCDLARNAHPGVPEAQTPRCSHGKGADLDHGAGVEAALAWLFQGVPPPGMPIQAPDTDKPRSRGRDRPTNRRNGKVGWLPDCFQTMVVGCRFASLPDLHSAYSSLHGSACSAIHACSKGVCRLHAALDGAKPTGYL